VSGRLRVIMDRAYEEVAAAAKERQLSLRQAAHLIGVGRVAEAYENRGLFP
jgi:glutamate dehydrogenase (NAD(P)+)